MQLTYHLQTEHSAMQRTITKQTETTSVGSDVSTNMTTKHNHILAIGYTRCWENLIPYLPFAPKSKGIM